MHNLNFSVLLLMDKQQDKDMQYLIVISLLWVTLTKMNLEEVEFCEVYQILIPIMVIGRTVRLK